MQVAVMYHIDNPVLLIPGFLECNAQLKNIVDDSFDIPVFKRQPSLEQVRLLSIPAGHPYQATPTDITVLVLADIVNDDPDRIFWMDHSILQIHYPDVWAAFIKKYYAGEVIPVTDSVRVNPNVPKCPSSILLSKLSMLTEAMLLEPETEKLSIGNYRNIIIAELRQHSVPNSDVYLATNTTTNPRPHVKIPFRANSNGVRLPEEMSGGFGKVTGFPMPSAKSRAGLYTEATGQVPPYEFSLKSADMMRKLSRKHLEGRFRCKEEVAAHEMVKSMLGDMTMSFEQKVDMLAEMISGTNAPSDNCRAERTDVKNLLRTNINSAYGKMRRQTEQDTAWARIDKALAFINPENCNDDCGLSVTQVEYLRKLLKCEVQ